MAENISDIFFALDREFRIMYWNLAVEAFTKLKAKEVLGKSIFEMFPDFLDSSIEKAFRKVMVSAQSRTILYTHSLDQRRIYFRIQYLSIQRRNHHFCEECDGKDEDVS